MNRRYENMVAEGLFIVNYKFKIWAKNRLQAEKRASDLVCESKLFNVDWFEMGEVEHG
jgi:hypothetical protein